MTETRREAWRKQIRIRLEEMTCIRASEPIAGPCPLGWARNEDGTCTRWQVGPGPSLDEQVTLRADVEPADFEQLQLMLWI